MVTDSHAAYPAFAESEKIQLEQIEPGKHSKGAYNLGRINAEHAKLAAFYPKQNNQTTTSNFPCNFNFAVSNMNRFNQGIYHG